MMFRIVAMLAVLSGALGLAACSSQSESTAGGSLPVGTGSAGSSGSGGGY